MDAEVVKRLRELEAIYAKADSASTPLSTQTKEAYQAYRESRENLKDHLLIHVRALLLAAEEAEGMRRALEKIDALELGSAPEDECGSKGDCFQCDEAHKIARAAITPKPAADGPKD